MRQMLVQQGSQMVTQSVTSTDAVQTLREAGIDIEGASAGAATILIGSGSGQVGVGSGSGSIGLQ